MNQIRGHINTIFTLKYCLYRAVKLTKNTDPDKYSHSGYILNSIHVHFFLISNVDLGKNLITFGTDISSSTHANNREKVFQFLVKG